MRMALTKPTTLAGAAALIDHTRREIMARTPERVDDWLVTALKTAASGLPKWRPHDAHIQHKRVSK